MLPKIATSKTFPFQDLNKKVRSVLNKLTPEKFDFFSVAYAMMCQTLSRIQVSVNKDPAKPGSEMVHFQKLLLTRCQKEFERQSDSKENLRREERLKEIQAVEG
ncbi:hypothetical protein B566_EDAN015689, partial [Ephemera danica]